MRIAFNLSNLIGKEEDVLRYANQHLKLIHRREIAPLPLLTETAQFYGIFVPTSEGMWIFVHRTMHDYLAARYWVESGGFVKHNIKEWNTRAAYAACLTRDATPFIEQALKHEESINMFTECLYNNAAVEPTRVAAAVIDHFTNFPIFTHQRESDIINLQTSQNFFGLASDDLIRELVIVGLEGQLGYRKPSHDLVLAFAWQQAMVRKLQFTPWVLRKLRLIRDDIKAFRLSGVNEPSIVRLTI
jgi:hypothetical protein